MAKKNRNPEGLADLDGDPGSPFAPEPVEPYAPTYDSTPAPQEKPVVKLAEVTPPPKPVVPYRAFKALSGVKPDKMAGFERWVAREQMKPATVMEWRARYANFMARPVPSLRKR